MSCIQKLLELKNKSTEPFFKINARNVIEGGGQYKGYDYLITFIDVGHRCGYIAISPDHPLYSSELYPLKKTKISIEDLLEVHGGVTFFDTPHLINDHKCGDKWIGFDSGHCWDIPDIKFLRLYFPLSSSWRSGFYYADIPEASLKTQKYMEEQCKLLINQLIEKEIKGG
jgi:hypothetical protein